MEHESVLLQETINGLQIKDGDIFVDATIGVGGHSMEVCKRHGGGVKMFAIDADEEAIERSKKQLSNCAVTYCVGNFKNIDEILAQNGVTEVQRVLFDLGWAVDQFMESGRGFSFQKDEPLIMSFKKHLLEEDLTAREIVNTWSEEHLVDILVGFGEESFAKRIVKHIAEYRAEKPIETTTDLVSIIKKATPSFYHHRRIHPATKTFQALRIAVNDEIGSLNEGMSKAFQMLSKGGRMAVISFHSIEDRVVKRFFRDKANQELALLPFRKPIIAEREEVLRNPRSRSAKLRIIEKV